MAAIARFYIVVIYKLLSFEIICGNLFDGISFDLFDRYLADYMLCIMIIRWDKSLFPNLSPMPHHTVVY